MDPVSMGMSAVSALMPMLQKGMEAATDMMKNMGGSQGQEGQNGSGKIGEDTHQKNSAQITFS